MVFALYGIGQDGVGLFREGKEAELGIIKEPIDEMELDQYFLTQQFRPVEHDLMIFEIIDILYLEGRHAYFPDDFTGTGAELDIMRSDQCIGQISTIMIL